jgi:hypothetical protein
MNYKMQLDVYEMSVRLVAETSKLLSYKMQLDVLTGVLRFLQLDVLIFYRRGRAG